MDPYCEKLIVKSPASMAVPAIGHSRVAGTPTEKGVHVIVGLAGLGCTRYGVTSPKTHGAMKV